jgi:hypothetical protein
MPNLSVLLTIVDVLAAIAACAASMLWYQASRRPMRRISRFEEIDALDFNRMVTAFNRAQILNARAAAAATVAALLAALRFALDAALSG